MPDLTDFAKLSLERLQKARAIADDLKHDDGLHRLAMRAVFILEDCHETLARFAAEVKEAGAARS